MTRAKRIEKMAEAAAMKYWHSFSKEFRWAKDADWQHCGEGPKNIWRMIITAALDAVDTNETKL